MARRVDDAIPHLKRLLPAHHLGWVARGVGFIQRLREIRAGPLVWALVLSRLDGGRPGFEAARQRYHQLTKTRVWPRPFQMRFKQKSVLPLLRRAFDDAVRPWRQVVHSRRHPLARLFTDVVAWDSTLVALPDCLRRWFKGIFGHRAALKVCLAISVFGRVPLLARVTRANRHDARLFPDLQSFRAGTLWLFDKGFVAYSFLADVIEAGQHFLCPMRLDGNPTVVGAQRAPSHVRKALRASPEGIPLRCLLRGNRRIGKSWDLRVRLRSKRAFPAVHVDARLVIVPGPDARQRPYLTTLAPVPFAPPRVAEVYRLRWQIELTFKELKSHLNLETIPTKDRVSAQAFVWASLIALAVSRAVAWWLVPLSQLEGLSSRLRVDLLTRALRGVVWTLVSALSGSLSPAAGTLTDLRKHLLATSAPTRPARTDSFARLMEPPLLRAA